MKFYIQLLLLVINLSSLSAVPIDKREINSTSVELEYFNNMDVSDDDWQEICSYQNTLEKFKIRMRSFYFINRMKNNLIDVHVPILREMDLAASNMWYAPPGTWPRGATGEYINNEVLTLISHQENLEVLNLDAWDFGTDNTIWHVLSDDCIF